MNRLEREFNKLSANEKLGFGFVEFKFYGLMPYKRAFWNLVYVTGMDMYPYLKQLFSFA
jgi:hypothetical protein